MKLIRKDITEKIMENWPDMPRRILKSDLEQIVVKTLETLTEFLANGDAGDKIELRGLGTFFIRRSKAKTCHNPHTGQAIKIKPRLRCVFKPGHFIQTKLKNKIK